MGMETGWIAKRHEILAADGNVWYLDYAGVYALHKLTKWFL